MRKRFHNFYIDCRYYANIKKDQPPVQGWLIFRSIFRAPFADPVSALFIAVHLIQIDKYELVVYFLLPDRRVAQAAIEMQIP